MVLLNLSILVLSKCTLCFKINWALSCFFYAFEQVQMHIKIEEIEGWCTPKMQSHTRKG